MPEKTCPRCASVFACGPAPGREDSRCWCNDLPALRTISGDGCLCPACLTASVAAQSADGDHEHDEDA